MVDVLGGKQSYWERKGGNLGFRGRSVVKGFWVVILLKFAITKMKIWHKNIRKKKRKRRKRLHLMRKNWIKQLVSPFNNNCLVEIINFILQLWKFLDFVEIYTSICKLSCGHNRFRFGDSTMYLQNIIANILVNKVHIPIHSVPVNI